MSSVETQVRKLQMMVIASLIVATIAAALSGVTLRQARPKGRSFDDHALNALILSVYLVEHPRPQGPVEDPAVRNYDATYEEYRRRVVEIFDDEMAHWKQQDSD